VINNNVKLRVTTIESLQMITLVVTYVGFTSLRTDLLWKSQT